MQQNANMGHSHWSLIASAIALCPLASRMSAFLASAIEDQMYYSVSVSFRQPLEESFSLCYLSCLKISPWLASNKWDTIWDVCEGRKVPYQLLVCASCGRGEQWLMHWLAPFATDVNLHVKELRAIEVVFLSASLHWLQAPLTWLDGSLAVLFFYRRCLTDPPRVHACRSNRMNSFATATWDVKNRKTSNVTLWRKIKKKSSEFTIQKLCSREPKTQEFRNLPCSGCRYICDD